MFKLDKPSESVPIIKGNQFVEGKKDGDEDEDSDRIVVVAVIGTSNLPSRSGFKRAFQLAIDTFGNPRLFRNEADDESGSEDEERVEDPETKVPSMETGHEEGDHQLVGQTDEGDAKVEEDCVIGVAEELNHLNLEEGGVLSTLPMDSEENILLVVPERSKEESDDEANVVLYDSKEEKEAGVEAVVDVNNIADDADAVQGSNTMNDPAAHQTEDIQHQQEREAASYVIEDVDPEPINWPTSTEYNIFSSQTRYGAPDDVMSAVELVGQDGSEKDYSEIVPKRSHHLPSYEPTLDSKAPEAAAADIPSTDAEEASVVDSCIIDGFYCKRESTLFLHLRGADDPQQLLTAADQLKDQIRQNGFLSTWSSLRFVYCRYLLLLFSLSHIVILSDVGSSFNSIYLQLFRMLDAVRLALKPAMSSALEAVGILNKDWVLQGRICSPRLLFLFEVDGDKPENKTLEDLVLSNDDGKRSELEDEIYHIFRKCRIITNISANSLFAIPAEDDYIFLFDKSAGNVGYADLPPVDLHVEMINQLCVSSKLQRSSSPTKLPPPAYRSTSGTSIKQLFRPQALSVTYRDMLEKFKEFTLYHTRFALTDGFDDDSKRVAEYKHFFVTPTLGEWKIGFKILYDALLKDDAQNEDITDGLKQLKRYINVDIEYLRSQCSTAFPKIYALYQRNLPEYYSERTHQLRLTMAMNAFLTISRGAGVVPWLNKLAEKCTHYWTRGRQQCETLSLFKHQCVNPLHRVKEDDNLEILPLLQLDDKHPETKHSAGAKIVAHCNCGRKQGYRDEPFTIREANFAFYNRLGTECCEQFDKITFPIFASSSSETEKTLEDMLKILKTEYDLHYPAPNLFGREIGERSQELMDIDLKQEENLIQDEGEAEEEIEESEAIPSQGTSGENEKEKDGSSGLTIMTPPMVEPNLIKLTSIFAPTTVDIEISDTEYLPGMHHSQVPPGLLPKFPSWSLVKLGNSSLYNHSSGIAPRSSFLSGTNFLLPWDCLVKAEEGVAKPVPRSVKSRKAANKLKPITDEFTVKVFFGMEYECPRGHRFIANDVDRTINFGHSNTSLREVACKMIGSDVLLYFVCPCKESREGRPVTAQLMRIHVVTPKAPVHCILYPKVQPGTFTPIFSPGNIDQICLPPSSYWVLRLPYCYVGEYVHEPPNDTPESVSRSRAKLLRGMITIKSMTPAETKTWEKENL